jgi:hydrogenase nickel incorporation protein HypB
VYPVRLIHVKENILSDNQDLAEQIRERLKSKKVFMLNLMASPGAGKTSLILETIRRMKATYRIAVIEGDIESQVDADKIAAEGIPAVQLRTGGACHLDASMIEAALDTMDLESLDLIIIENVGNLVCPAEFDTGATRQGMLLSIPEGDDKVIKYPLMFSVCDAVVVSKTDYLAYADFNLSIFKENVRKLNPAARLFELSCKTGEGLEGWCRWLEAEIKDAAYRLQ